MRSFISTMLLLLSSVARADLAVDFWASRYVAGPEVEIAFEAGPLIDGNVAVSYQWSLADGSIISEDSKFSYSFEFSGEYEVQLQIKDMFGNSGYSKKVFSILSNSFPKANFFFWDKNEIIVNQEVSFFSQASDPDNNILKTDWVVDGPLSATGVGREFKFKFTKAGKYLIIHSVEDRLGAVAIESRSIEVFEENRLPVLEIEVPSLVAVAELVRVKFKATDRDGKIEKLFWKIGSMPEYEVGSGPLEVLFPLKGIHRFFLRALDNRGGSTEASVLVHVYHKDREILGQIENRPRSPQVGQEVLFDLSVYGSTNSISSIAWDFGDGAIIYTTEKQIRHSYARPGVYKAQCRILAGNSSFNCKPSKIKVSASRLRTSPVEQVIINEPNYLELALTQEIEIDISGYDNVSSHGTFGSVVWTPSNSNISVTTLTGTTAKVKGISAGDVTLTVTADGISSPPIAIKVLPFVSGAVVAKKGKFVGGERDQFCFYVNELRSAGGNSYSYNSEYVSYVSLPFSPIFNSDYKGLCINSLSPSEKSSMTFHADNSGVASYTYQKNFTVFNGRNGYQSSGQAGGTISLIGNDSRFFEWDQDFSITYWHWLNGESFGFMPFIDGKHRLGAVGRVGSNGPAVFSDASEKKVFLPQGSSFSARWSHVGLTYSAASSQVKVYIDGQFIGSYNLPGSAVNLSRKFDFVSDSESAIDELRLWNKELSGAEVESDLFAEDPNGNLDLIANYSFDSDTFYEAENDPSWSYRLHSNEPRESSLSYVQSSYLLANNVRVNVQSDIKFLLSPSQYSSGEVVIKNEGGIPKNYSDISIQVLERSHSGSLIRVPYSMISKRFSPFFYITSFEVFPEIMVKIPFDVLSVNKSDLHLLKIGHATLYAYGIDEFSILEPNEINVDQGYISIKSNFPGYFWVTIPESHFGRAPQYSNNDLFPTKNADGYRGFYADIPNSQSTYSLQVSNSSSAIAASVFNCSPSGQSGVGSLSLSLTSLSSAVVNTCFFNYTYGAGLNALGETLAYDWIDIVQIKRESP